MAAKIGTLLDRYFRLRSDRLALERDVAKLKARETEAGEALREAMNAEKTDKATTASGTVSLKEVDVPKVVDWDAFYGFVHRRKLAHLLQRRLHEGNVEELLEHDARLRKAGLPGVEFARVQKMTASAARS